MYSTPLVSVIINCFNGEQFINKCLQSVINQTHKNLEIIIWNNKSTDNSLEVVRRINDNRIKIFNSDVHTNISIARNRALNNSKGEYICFLDVDDFWDTNKINKQLKSFEKKNVGLSFTNFWYVKINKYQTSKKNIKLKFEGGLINKIIKKYEIVLSTIMIKRNLLSKLKKPFNEKFHIISDFDFTLKLANITSFDHIEEPLTYRIWHGKNETILKRRAAVKEIETWVEENEYYNRKYQNEINFLKYKILYDKINFSLKDKNYLKSLKLFFGNNLSAKLYYLKNILLRIIFK